jgi:hypothetical protein
MLMVEEHLALAGRNGTSITIISESLQSPFKIRTNSIVTTITTTTTSLTKMPRFHPPQLPSTGDKRAYRKLVQASQFTITIILQQPHTIIITTTMLLDPTFSQHNK